MWLEPAYILGEIAFDEIRVPVRDECLNINIFWSLAQARVVITDWKEEYNEHRRHSALAYKAPARYAAACTHRD
jgi:transposase InsO family protein